MIGRGEEYVSRRDCCAGTGRCGGQSPELLVSGSKLFVNKY